MAGLRWLRRPHSVVAATTVWLLAVDGKASVVVLLGLAAAALLLDEREAAVFHWDGQAGVQTCRETEG